MNCKSKNIQATDATGHLTMGEFHQCLKNHEIQQFNVTLNG